MFPALRRQEQAGFWKLEASLVCIANSRPGRGKKKKMRTPGCRTFVIEVLGRQRPEGHKLETTLSYIAYSKQPDNSYHKKAKACGVSGTMVDTDVED